MPVQLVADMCAAECIIICLFYSELLYFAVGFIILQKYCNKKNDILPKGEYIILNRVFNTLLSIFCLNFMLSLQPVSICKTSFV